MGIDTLVLLFFFYDLFTCLFCLEWVFFGFSGEGRSVCWVEVVNRTGCEGIESRCFY